MTSSARRMKTLGTMWGSCGEGLHSQKNIKVEIVFAVTHDKDSVEVTME